MASYYFFVCFVVCCVIFRVIVAVFMFVWVFFVFGCACWVVFVFGFVLWGFFWFVRSWNYVNKEHIFMGNGMGHTPEIWNIYAYVLSDLGLIAFILFCIFSVFLIIKNYKMGILFIVLNFQKGGYLSSAFWSYLLLLFIYINKNDQKAELSRECLKDE